MAKKNSAQSEQLQEVLQTLLELLGVQATLVSSQEDDTTYLFTIATETPALVIGYHGKTLSALQTVLKVIAYQKFGQLRVILDVDGWRKKRDESIVQLAQATASRAKTFGVPQPLYNLTPYERRVVHVALSEDPDIVTESEGEGRDRHIVVKLKQSTNSSETE